MSINGDSEARSGTSISVTSAEWYARSLEHVFKVMQEVSVAHDLSTILATVSHAARELTGADGATVSLRDGDQCFYADENAIGPLWRGQYLSLDSCSTGWVILHRQPLVIEDVRADPRAPEERYRTTFVSSLIEVPIRVHDPIGAIGVYWEKQCRPSQEQISVLQALATAAAVAIENLRTCVELLHRAKDQTVELELAGEELQREVERRKKAEAGSHGMTFTDETTGLYNRPGFLAIAEQVLLLGRRSKTFAWVLAIHVDGLREINERLGRDAGDRSICAASRVVKESFRESDVLGRLGGDEFVALVLSSYDVPQLLKDRLQYNLDRFNGTGARECPILSVSVGIARSEPNAGSHLEELVGEAERALSEQKLIKRAHHMDSTFAA